MRNLLYMFNQRSTKYVLPVFFIGTLFLSFASTNIFCRPPSLLLTSSTIDNDNNLADPTDNNSQNVDVKSDSTSNSSSDNNSTESNSKSSLDNSTWLNVYEFNSI